MAEMANELLLYAAENGSLEGVKTALKAGADIDCDQPADSDIIRSGTPLYHASFNGHVDIVKLLLRKEASVAKRTRFSFATLHAAANGGRTEVVDLLVQHGATLDIRDAWQYTPLMCASMYKHVGTVRRLIEHGARADLTDGPGRSLVAQRYCELGMEIGRHGSEECLKLLEDARKSKLLRCCNPKCGKPGYRLIDLRF
ncbi:poly [ADP-ribose] polymerase tankyrase-2-like [Branchiostoma floridae]|uniref:Poly [ADP-ribose] polymerase tankyrase-2-like n=1 Tax=Branchiostoma floridae TaxID=7739 RepID=A0A9J7MXJ2_BRAFL|nr:poly [ADP-ribose] polymerase tankyrase-2-like [Branchiostoma floridae]